MYNQISVDWEKTSINIKNRLSGIVRSKTFSNVFNLTEEAIYSKLRGKPLTIEELYIFATFLNCNLKDLIVFTGEKFVEPYFEKVSTRDQVSYSSSEQIYNTIKTFSNWYNECNIRNLQEFFLYLPLMDIEVLKDVAFRCNGNYKDKFYFFNKINYLYESIEDSPAKKHADKYRDAILRVKGDGDMVFKPNKYDEFFYLQALLLFSSQITKAEFNKAILNYSENEVY